MQSKWINEIEGYENVLENSYKIYENGVVESYRSTLSDGNTFYHFTSNEPQINLKNWLTRKGYEKVQLSTITGKKKTPYVHRLVASAFIPNPEGKPQVNHIDGNKKNNHAFNLEWVTNQENHNHKLKMGLNVSLSGDKHYTHTKEKFKNYHHARRKVQQLDLDGNIVHEFESFKDAARDLKLDPSSISKAVSGKYKTSGGFMWREVK